MLTIILMLISVICYSVILGMYKPQAAYKNGMLFAVKLPEAAAGHEELKQVQDSFNKQFLYASLWMGGALVPMLFLHDLSAFQVIYFFVWSAVLSVVMAMPFRKAFARTLALKREHEWFVGDKRVVLTDLRVAQHKNARSAPLWLFIFPFAMSVGLLWWSFRQDDQSYGVTACGIFLTALFFLVSLYMRKTRAKVYSMNTEINLVLNQAKRRALSYLWLWMAVAENVHVFLIFMLVNNETGNMEGAWLAVIVLFAAIPVGAIYAVYRKIQALERDMLEHDGKTVYTDDDEYWVNGFTYHNPHDKSVFVPKRIGMGGTVNTATVPGKIIKWGSFGLIAAVVVGVSFMLIRSELTSPSLAVTQDDKVEIHYPMYSFDFSLADIKELTLVDAIPGGTKTNGEATNQYARGHFRLKEAGKARLYVFKNNPPYIRIKLEGVTIYYNEKDSQQTKKLFESLQQAGQ